MFTQLLFYSTAHFGLTVLAAFVFFAAGLLFLDSWQVDKTKKTPFLRSIGFFMLSITEVIYATSISVPFVLLLSQIIRVSGLIMILISLIKEPVLSKPKHRNRAIFAYPLAITTLSNILAPVSAILFFLISATYLRKSTEGLEKQLKPAFLGFLFLGISEFIKIVFSWQDTQIVFWSKIFAPFGIAWSIQHLFELIGIIIFGAWVWGYIRFRLQVQLFVMTVGMSVVVFLVTTFLFSFLLLNNLQTDALSHLKTDVRVVQYAIERLQAEALANATAIAENPDVKNAFISKNGNDLYNLTSHLMLSYKTNFLAVTNTTGQVVMRGEDKDNVGDTLIFDPTVKSALSGKRLATVISQEGAIAPQVEIKAAAPFYDSSNKIQGAVSTGFWIDSAFVDGVKDVTGLDVTIFGGNKRAATTFISPDGKSRFVGTLETNKSILNTVLAKGEIYTGATNVLNQPYYSAYAPLNTFGNKPIGMLFVGKPQTTLFAAAQNSINLTFLGSAILIVISLIPAYFFSKFLKEHLEA